MKTKAEWQPGAFFNETVPKFGIIYTIRAINHSQGKNFLHFVEIRNPIISYSDFTGEMDFWADKFRPIVSRPTSIEIFKKMLTPTEETV